MQYFALDWWYHESSMVTKGLKARIVKAAKADVDKCMIWMEKTTDIFAEKCDDAGKTGMGIL